MNVDIIIMNLQEPPAINKTRRIDWAHASAHRAWKAGADMMVIASGLGRHRIEGRYEAIITVSEASRLDLDSTIKSLLDFAVRIEVVQDDSKKYLRQITVRWAANEDAPEGVRLELRAFT